MATSMPMTVWRAARVPFPVAIPGDPPYFPDLIIVVDERNVPVTQHMLPPGSPSAEVMAQLRAEALQHGDLPTVLLTDHPELAQALRVALPDVLVRDAEIPELRQLLEALEPTLITALREPRFIEHVSVTPDMVTRFFAAAMPILAHRPWDLVRDEGQALRVDIPALGVAGGVLVIIGNAGESQGVVLFRTLEQYEHAADWVASDDELPDTPPPDMLGVEFVARASLPHAMKAELKKHRWKAGRTVPTLAHFRQGLPEVITADDYALATACCAALDAFLGKHAPIFAAADPGDVSETVTVELDVPVQVTLRPMADRWDAPSIFVDLEDEDEAMLNRFGEHVAETVDDETLEETCVVMAEAMLVFLRERAAPPVSALTGTVLREFMLEFVPSQVVVAGPSDVGLIPKGIATFIEWLVEEGEVSRDEGRRLLATLKRHTPQLTRRMFDPRNLAVPRPDESAELHDASDVADYLARLTAAARVEPRRPGGDPRGGRR